MGKNPSFPFYPSDWTRDLDDQDLEIEGAWIRICCRLWWMPECGKATKSIKEWSKVLRKTEKKTIEIFQKLIKKGIASGEVLNNQTATIINRRMVRQGQISQLRQEVGRYGGNPAFKKGQKNPYYLDKQKITKTITKKISPSSSSSSSSSKKEIYSKNAHLEFVFLTAPEYQKLVEQFGDGGAKERIARLNVYLGSTGKKYKSHYYTILSWEKNNGGSNRANTPVGQAPTRAQCHQDAKVPEGRRWSGPVPDSVKSLIGKIGG
jgi:hypothetical protein